MRAHLCFFLFLVTACGGLNSEPVQHPQPEETLTQIPEDPPEPSMPEAVEATKDELIRYARVGSLSGLTRVAKRSEAFVSNFGGEDHRAYWDLMRRIGVVPNQKLIELFAEPVGKRYVDEEVWYIWPDLAALDAADLIPEKLSFQDRKHLLELVGEDGIAKVRAGQGYPGKRTAISEDGRWIYFVLDTDEGD